MYLPFNDGKWAAFVSYCFAIPVPCHLWLRIATCIAFKQHLFSSNYCSILQGLVKFWCYGGKKKLVNNVVLSVIDLKNK